MTGLAFGPPGDRVLHIGIDLQRVFAEPGEWYTPALAGILPGVLRLVEHRPQDTLLTRFITPRSAAQARGAWVRYYRHWSGMTLAQMDAARLDLVAPLANLIPPAQVVDKTTHCVFESPAFTGLLAQRQTDTLIFSGVETDVCVLASVMTAVDRGFRVIVVSDAVSSSSEAGHRAALECIYPRFDQQIELATVATVLEHWPRA